MNWGSREECHCPSTVWEERIFDLDGIRKKYLICCKISRSKTRYLMFQHKSLFNLVKALFKWIEGLGRSVTVRESTVWEGKKFDLGGIRKNYLIRCQISHSKTRYKVFQHKSLLLFNLVKDIFKWIEGLERNFTAFQPSQGLIQMNWSLVRSVTVRVQTEGERIFALGGLRKKYLIRCQISRSKTRYKAFQHKSLSLFNLVKDLFKWIEGLERSVNVRVHYEGERFFDCPSKVRGGKIFWPRWYTKKVLDTLSNFALKTPHLMFQLKSLFNLVKDFFKWIEGLVRSITVRVQSEGERVFDLGGIWKKYLIRSQISRSKLAI